MYTFLSFFIISIKSDKSQCLRGNESKLLSKSLHWILGIIYGQILNIFLNIDIIIKSGIHIEIQDLI